MFFWGSEGAAPKIPLAPAACRTRVGVGSWLWRTRLGVGSWLVNDPKSHWILLCRTRFRCWILQSVGPENPSLQAQQSPLKPQHSNPNSLPVSATAASSCHGTNQTKSARRQIASWPEDFSSLPPPVNNPSPERISLVMSTIKSLISKFFWVIFWISFEICSDFC